ncbi:MAG TPA: nucleoside triphosphate pyrophosphohydrolase [Myxococcales bacterium]|jgi:tetrapyrrole methylase family protein/MazG family protein|nr:nucleoside triphosphate pyrophosphohydrolase [Myxococcales bacterium]
MSDPEKAIRRLLEIMDRLRDPGGCPWDREQTLKTLTPYLLEEAHEVIEAIESDDAQHHREELGDLLFQVVFQARIAREEGKFDFAQVCDAISDKLTRRHPHVFGDASVSGSREVVRNWERIKAEERREKGQAERSAIGGVPVALPALVRGERMTEKAAAVGFDWPDQEGVLAKVHEELGELEEALRSGARDRVEQELGDLLFAIANLGRWVKVHPEEALRGTLRRFESRFHFIESKLAERGSSPGESTLEEMDALWNAAKEHEKSAS